MRGSTFPAPSTLIGAVPAAGLLEAENELAGASLCASAFPLGSRPGRLCPQHVAWDAEGSSDLFLTRVSGFGGDFQDGAPLTDAPFDAQAGRVAKTSAVRFIWEADATRL